MPVRGIGYFIKMIDDKLKVRADAALKEHNLTLAQSRVLMLLDERGGQATQKELEELFDVSHPTVVGIVSRMEQNGYVETWLDPKVQRSKMVRLTPKARAIDAEMSAMIQEQEDAMLRGLTGEQIGQLEWLLDAVCRNLTEGTSE